VNLRPWIAVCAALLKDSERALPRQGKRRRRPQNRGGLNCRRRGRHRRRRRRGRSRSGFHRRVWDTKLRTLVNLRIKDLIRQRFFGTWAAQKTGL